MSPEEARAVADMLAAVFDVPAWTDEHKASFERAIMDLPYECAKEAAQRWIRNESRRPLPADIRKIAQTITPTRKLLPPPLDIPKQHRKEDVGKVEMLSDTDKRKILATYIERIRATSRALKRYNPQNGRLMGIHRPDLAYEAIRLDVEGYELFLEGDVQERERRHEHHDGDGSLSEVVETALRGRTLQ